MLVLEDVSGATEAIVAFARDGNRVIERRKFLACLRECVPDDPSSESDRAVLSPSNADVQVESGEPSDCGREILSLHKTLSTYCVCVQDEVHHSMSACIRLSVGKSDESKVTFGVLFMDHPHRHAIGMMSQPHWQDTEISLYRTVSVSHGGPLLLKLSSVLLTITQSNRN